MHENKYQQVKWHDASRSQWLEYRLQRRDLDLAAATQHRQLARANHPTAARSRQRRVDSGSRQTLFVLQFMIEFANIWAQYCPSTYGYWHGYLSGVWCK